MTDGPIPESNPEPVWRTSRHSGGNSQCVEVASRVAGAVAVRDSKNRARPALRFPPTEWAAFIDGLRGGQLG